MQLNPQPSIQRPSKAIEASLSQLRAPTVAGPTDIASHTANDFVSKIRRLRHRLPRGLRWLYFEEQWRIGVRPSISGLDVSRVFDLKDFLVLTPPRDRFYADPFLVEHGRRNYLFFEELIFARNKGVISCIEFDDQGFRGTPHVVLEAEHHLSYPFVFDWEGQTYMLPESRDSGRIRLFRAVEFPLRWEFSRNLLDDVWAVDPTIFQHGGKFWMFAGGVKK